MTSGSAKRRIEEVATSITAFLGRARRGPRQRPIRVGSFDDFERVFGPLHDDYPLGYAVRDFFRNGGTRGIIVRIPPSGTDDAGPGRLTAADLIGSEEDRTGLFALPPAKPFNLLCIPPDARGGSTDPAVYRRAAAFCEQRRAMLIVDSPASWAANGSSAALLANPAAALAEMGIERPSARNAAIYFPRLIEANPPAADQSTAFASCGAVAGVIARTDARDGVWTAPAGTASALSGVQGLEVSLRDNENETLNRVGINCLRSFPALGWVIWGARTICGADASADEYKYIPVRRLALFIEESLYRGLKWVVFEPNDEALWAEIRLSIGDFMQDLFQRGAFRGSTPREAYFVKCDAESTAQADLDLGIVDLVVGFAPLKPSEFVILTLRQLAGHPRPNRRRRRSAQRRANSS